MSLADLRNHWLCRIHRPFPPSSGGSSNEAVIRNQGIVCERRFHHDLLIPGEQPLDTDDLGCKRRTMRVTCQSANDENFDLRTRQRSRPTAPRASSPLSSRRVLVIAKCDASLVPGGAQACLCPQVGCTSRESGCIECRSRCPPRGLRDMRCAKSATLAVRGLAADGSAGKLGHNAAVLGCGKRPKLTRHVAA